MTMINPAAEVRQPELNDPHDEVETPDTYYRLGDYIRDIVIDDGHTQLYLNEIAALELAARLETSVGLLRRAVEAAEDAS